MSYVWAYSTDCRKRNVVGNIRLLACGKLVGQILTDADRLYHNPDIGNTIKQSVTHIHPAGDGCHGDRCCSGVINGSGVWRCVERRLYGSAGRVTSTGSADHRNGKQGWIYQEWRGDPAGIDNFKRLLRTGPKGRGH